MKICTRSTLQESHKLKDQETGSYDKNIIYLQIKAQRESNNYLHSQRRYEENVDVKE